MENLHLKKENKQNIKVFNWHVREYYDFVYGDRETLSFQVDLKYLRRLKQMLPLEKIRRNNLEREKIADFEADPVRFREKYNPYTFQKKRKTKWIRYWNDQGELLIKLRK